MRILTLFLLAPLLGAQDRPRFVWQGDVDGTVILHLRGDRLDSQIKDGGPVAGQQFHFYDRLPETRQTARLEVRKGRGFVHIVEQPNLDNHYTLSISIEDRQEGASFYSIALFWDISNTPFERGPGRTDKVTWSGRVDQEALISCRAKICTSGTVLGAPVAAEKYKFSRPMPLREMEVNIENQDGRGEIKIVEQPRERNNYTTRVSIRDPQSGFGDYAFTLVWKRPSKNEPPRPVLAPERAMTWTGVVSGRVRVTIHGSSAISEIVQGAPISGERTDIFRPLPANSDLQPAIKKIAGPGSVEIVETPSQQNHYSLTFEIKNTGAAASYRVEVSW